jgi:hypothetical protein
VKWAQGIPIASAPPGDGDLVLVRWAEDVEGLLGASARPGDGDLGLVRWAQDVEGLLIGFVVERTHLARNGVNGGA